MPDTKQNEPSTRGRKPPRKKTNGDGSKTPPTPTVGLAKDVTETDLWFPYGGVPLVLDSGFDRKNGLKVLPGTVRFIFAARNLQVADQFLTKPTIQITNVRAAEGARDLRGDPAAASVWELSLPRTTQSKCVGGRSSNLLEFKVGLQQAVGRRRNAAQKAIVDAFLRRDRIVIDLKADWKYIVEHDDGTKETVEKSERHSIFLDPGLKPFVWLPLDRRLKAHPW